MNYVFTLNNYSEDSTKRLQSLIDDKTLRYVIYGREIAPTTQTPHLQGYLETYTGNRIKGLLKKLDLKGIHLESRRGTQQQATEYCMKSDKQYVELGIPSRTSNKGSTKSGKQGERTDILNIWSCIKQGYSQQRLLEEFPLQYTKWGKAIDKYYTICEPARDRDIAPEIIWHYGPTGSNKTKSVYDNEDTVFVPKNFKWWDGYDRHNVVLLDDIRGDYCKFHELLTLLDRYQYKVEVKGGMRQMVAKKIYITSPYHPRDVYRGRTNEDIQQLLRRITSIVYKDNNTDNSNSIPNEYITEDTVKISNQEAYKTKLPSNQCNYCIRDTQSSKLGYFCQMKHPECHKDNIKDILENPIVEQDNFWFWNDIKHTKQ